PVTAAARATQVPNLSLLRNTGLGAMAPGQIPIASIRRVLEEARHEYDMVIVDTGPCPGSLEASLLAPQADATVVVVALGSKEPEVAATIHHLSMLRANVTGVVFNRASASEAHTYTSASKKVTRRRSDASFDFDSFREEPEGEESVLGPVEMAMAGNEPPK